MIILWLCLVFSGNAIGSDSDSSDDEKTNESTEKVTNADPFQSTTEKHNKEQDDKMEIDHG